MAVVFEERLTRELSRWVDEGLVSARQAAAIRARYAGGRVLERRDRIVRSLAVVGAAVAGVGVVLFFAANWEAIPKSVRILALLSAVAGSYAAGYLLREVRRTRPAIGHALLLLGTILFGASLFLVGQMENVQAHDPLALLIWAAAAAGIASVVRSRPIATLAILVFGGWIGFELYALRPEGGYGLVLPGLAALYGAALYGAGTAGLVRLESVGFAGPMRGLGFVFGGAGLLVLTFRGFVRELDESVFAAGNGAIAALVVALVAAAAASGAMLLLRRGARATAPWEGLALLAVAGLVLAAGFAAGGAATLLFNLVVALIAVGAIVAGYHNDEEWLVNGGVVLVAVDVVARYFDTVWRMLPRSGALAGAGLLLLSVAWILERQRSRLVGTMRS